MAISLIELGKEYRPHRGKSFFTMGRRHRLVPVTHLEKHKVCELYWYCVQKWDDNWIAFDVRGLPNFDVLAFKAIIYWIEQREFVAKYLDNQNIQDYSFFNLQREEVTNV